MKTLGIILVVIGLVLTITTSAKFFTKEKVVDIGSVEITRNKPHTFDWPPALGLAIMAAGGIMIFLARKKS